MLVQAFLGSLLPEKGVVFSDEKGRVKVV